MSWDSRRGDTPRAGALRKCWGPLGRWQALPHNFPVQRSPLKYPRWRCCWSYPAGAQGKLILKWGRKHLFCIYSNGTQRSVSKALQGWQCCKEPAFCFIIITRSFWRVPSSTALVCVFHLLTGAAHTQRRVWGQTPVRATQTTHTKCAYGYVLANTHTHTRI